MANKRMFTMKIVDTDAFLDMPATAQNLYFHLNMRADDDGFIGNPKRVMKLIGSSEDDLKLLIMKSFILTFENGVIVIKHWRMHNTLSSQRYHETSYLDEKRMLLLKENGSYSFTSGNSIDDSKTKELFKRRTSGGQVEDADLDLDLDIDIDKYKNNISNKVKNPNINLFSNMFNEDSYKYICSNQALMNTFEAWLEYKEHGKKKTIYQERGIKTLMNQVVGYDKEYGTEKVIATIEDSISNIYAGICWDKIDRIKVFKNDSNNSIETNSESDGRQ